ncbi:transposase [Nonomuraea sp. NPDC050394]|uniref:transposase n=1 Tax=Nonomuraea sp. NPDC050394 TaxID=3364363 RepID=UPI0037980888
MRSSSCASGGDRSVGQVAKDFDLTETAVRDWIRQAEVNTGARDGLTGSEREQLAALRRENRRLREDVDILKRATLDSDDQRNAAGGWVDRGSDGSAGNVGCDEGGPVAAVARW